MEFTEAEKLQLRSLWHSHGDVLETIMVTRMVDRWVDEEQAREAAGKCAGLIWRNSWRAGTAAGLLIGTLGTPVAGGFAGGSMAVVAGYHTLLTADDCEDVRGDWDIQQAVRRVNAGLEN